MVVPSCCSDDSHHNRWVSTPALQLAGITKDAIPADGVTLLDPDDGEPSGVLLEAAGIARRAGRARHRAA